MNNPANKPAPNPPLFPPVDSRAQCPALPKDILPPRGDNLLFNGDNLPQGKMKQSGIVAMPRPSFDSLATLKALGIVQCGKRRRAKQENVRQSDLTKPELTLKGKS